MLTPPIFSKSHPYKLLRGDVAFWWPYVREALNRHDLLDATKTAVGGHNSTNPVFVYDGVAVKLFGEFHAWHEAYTAELAAHTLVNTDPHIATPALLAHGTLFDDNEASWPYLITPIMPGRPWWDAETSEEQDLTIAFEVGCQIKKVHALPITDAPKYEDWPSPDILYGAEYSVLPEHLIPQIDDFLKRTGPPDNVFLHGDLVDNHVYVKDGQFVGLIDWGDSLVMDRHYELSKLYLSGFNANKDLLKAFLNGSDWPMADDFAHRCMAMALHRQAMGLVQHFGFDTFYELPNLMDLNQFATLDELAEALFTV